MKRILLLAAGALGTAGMIAMAGPASADTATDVSTARAEPARKVRDSIEPRRSLTTFLYGNCGANLDDCPDPKRTRTPAS